MPGRVVLRLLLVSGVLLLLAALAAGWAMATPLGSAWLVRQALAAAPGSGLSIRVDRIDGTLVGDLRLEGLRLRGPEFDAAVARVGIAWQLQSLLAGTIHLRMLHLEQPHLVLRSKRQDPADPPALPRLPLALRIDRLDVRGAVLEDAANRIALDRLASEVRLASTTWTLTRLEAGGPAFDLRGRLTLATPDTNPTLGGELSGHLELPETGRVSGELALAGTLWAPRLDLRTRAPFASHLAFAADLSGSEPRFRADLTAKRAQWPLHGAAELVADDLVVGAEGTAESFRLAMTAGLRRDGLPPARLQLDGRGGPTRFTIDKAELALAHGRLSASGALESLQDRPQWQFDLQAKEVDTAPFVEGLRGTLQGRATLQGTLAEDGPVIALRISQLAGDLDDLPLRASGAILTRGETITLRELDIHHADNRLRLDGNIVAGVGDLHLAIAAPRLAASYPGLAGSLTGQARLRGTADKPALQGRFEGRDLAFRGMSLETLVLDADWAPEGGHLHLSGTRADLAGLPAERIEAVLDGTPEQHRLALDAKAGDGGLSLAAHGGSDGQSWQGTLDKLDLQAPRLGRWRTDAASALRMNAAGGELQRVCLRRETTALCAGGTWNDVAGFALGGSLQGLTLNELAVALGSPLRGRGAFKGDWRLQGPLQQPRLDLQLTSTEGALQVQVRDEDIEIGYAALRLAAGADAGGGDAELSFLLAGGGAARGSVHIGPAPAQPLQGQLRAHFPDLRLIEGFVPALRDPGGRMHVDMTLAGTLDDPAVRGELAVEGAGAQLATAGIELRDVGLRIRGDGQGPLQVSGSASSGPGKVTLAGTLDPRSSPWPRADLRITGKDFQAVRLPEIEALVSPELRLHGSRPYLLSGELAVPTAGLHFQTLPRSAVNVSADEVIEDGSAAQAAPRTRPLHANIDLLLGEQVRFTGFGLETRLTGSVTSTLDEQGARLQGKIALQDGTFKAYGQDLKIARGQLLFAGPPQRPDLRLQAARESRDKATTAFLEVQGTPERLRTRVYTEPPTPETDALSYLLTGRDLGQAKGSEGIDIANAALALGAAQGKPLLQEASNRAGLDDLRIESGADRLQQSTLVLGKYLNPDVYLGYSQNLFDPSGQALLKLRLGDRVDVESRAGEQQSVDLFYRLEHD